MFIMSEVIQFRGITKLDLDADTLLENNKGNFKHLLLIGYDNDEEFIFGSTIANGGDVLWLLEVAKIQLLRIAGEIE